MYTPAESYGNARTPGPAFAPRTRDYGRAGGSHKEHMAQLILQDGTVFSGASFGAATDTDGEVVFNTGMVGYPESMTDPSYCGQILAFTYPLIGNYGVPSEEKNAWGFAKNYESENIHVRAIVVDRESREFSHFAAVSSLHEWMKRHNVPGISGIDTRALTKKLREHGVMLGKIVQEELRATSYQLPEAGSSKLVAGIDDPNTRNLVAEVSCRNVETYEPEDGVRKTVALVVFDCGIKRNILRSWLRRGATVHRVPWDYDLSSGDLQYDGIFISNGPGDPKSCTKTIGQIKWAIENNVPTFGICLGNQLLGLAIGSDTYKMKYGHRGANQPCLEIGTDRCIITSQNHGFALSDDLPKGWSVWFRNANDNTVEGIRHESGRFFSVQFHPEATPGPEDAGYLFDEFLAVLR